MYTKKNNKGNSASGGEGVNTERKKEIIEKVSNLSPAEQETLLNVIRGMEIAKAIKDGQPKDETKAG